MKTLPSNRETIGSIFIITLLVIIFLLLISSRGHGQTFAAPLKLRPVPGRVGEPTRVSLTGEPLPAVPTVEPPSVGGGFGEIGQALLNNMSNTTWIPAVRIPLQKGGRVSYLLAGAYPVTDNVVLGGRLDFANTGAGYSVYGGSINCTWQVERKIFGVPTVGFVSEAVEFPLSGKSFGGFTVPGTPADSPDPFPLTSTGLAFKIYSHTYAGGQTLTVGLLGAYETGWKAGTESIITAPTLKYTW